MTVFRYLVGNQSFAHPQCAAEGCKKTDVSAIEVLASFYHGRVELRPPPPSIFGLSNQWITFTPCTVHKVELMQYVSGLGFGAKHIRDLGEDETRSRQRRDLRDKLEQEKYRRQGEKLASSKPLTPEEIRQTEESLGIKILRRKEG